MNFIKDLFKKDEGIIVPPAPQSLDEVKKKIAADELKAKVTRLNNMSREKGTLFCYKCGKVSGLYKLNLKKRFVKDTNTGKPLKIYVCNYCEG